METPNSPNQETTPIWELLRQAIAAEDTDSAIAILEEMPKGEAPRVLSLLDIAARTQLLHMLDPAYAARLLEQLSMIQILEMLQQLEPSRVAPILGDLPSNLQADLLSELNPSRVREVLQLMHPDKAAEAKRLAAYRDDTAGGIMITEYLSYRENQSVGDVLDDLRANTEAYRRHDVQYIYVTDSQEVLKGVLRLRDLVLTPPRTQLHKIMITDMDSVPVDTPQKDLREFFNLRPYRGVPVVDELNRLVGVVRHVDVAKAEGEQSASDHLKSAGIVGGDELRTMPVLLRSRRRLSWLSINIVLNIIAASIIAFYQDTLASAIALAVFLPIISDMSGCSGNQAIAVSMRELTLGVIQPKDAMRVWLKELSVGLINALVLGVLLGFAAWLWKDNLVLSLVVGVSLALNTLLAVSLGGLVPLVLRGLRMDPALASGPILTTVTDMCGFFLVLSLASMVLPALS